jgi:hypothetical protein
LCALPLLIAVPAIVMTVNDPALPLALAAQVTAVTLVGLALAVWMGQLAAERPLAYGLTLIDGGALASLLVSLILFEQYPRWLAHGSTGYIYVHLVVVAAGIGLLLAMTAVYTLWRRVPTPGALITLVAGLEIGYLFVPLCHYLFFCKDGGSWRDADYFSYVTSADNYFARNAWIQTGVWLAVALIAVGFNRLRVWLAGRRKGGDDANSV